MAVRTRVFLKTWSLGLLYIVSSQKCAFSSIQILHFRKEGGLWAPVPFVTPNRASVADNYLYAATAFCWTDRNEASTGLFCNMRISNTPMSPMFVYPPVTTGWHVILCVYVRWGDSTSSLDRAVDFDMSPPSRRAAKTATASGARKVWRSKTSGTGGLLKTPSMTTTSTTIKVSNSKPQTLSFYTVAVHRFGNSRVSFWDQTYLFTMWSIRRHSFSCEILAFHQTC